MFACAFPSLPFFVMNYGGIKAAIHVLLLLRKRLTLSTRPSFPIITENCICFRSQQKFDFWRRRRDTRRKSRQSRGGCSCRRPKDARSMLSNFLWKNVSNCIRRYRSRFFNWNCISGVPVFPVWATRVSASHGLGCGLLSIMSSTIRSLNGPSSCWSLPPASPCASKTSIFKTTKNSCSSWRLSTWYLRCYSFWKWYSSGSLLAFGDTLLVLGPV